MAEDGDNFTLVNLTDESSVIPTCLPSYSTLPVVFHDLAEVYPTDSDLKCRYSFTNGVSPKPGDCIALYKVGWSSVAEYIGLIYTPTTDVPNASHHKITFPVESLPKDEEMYQLCYLVGGNQLAGSSIPFSFRKPHEDELVAIEDPSDPGLVVFRSRETQLQDQLSMMTEAKEMLESEVASLSSKLEKVKSDYVKTSSKCIEQSYKITELESECQKLSNEKLSLEEEIENSRAVEILVEQLNSKLSTAEKENTEYQMLISKHENELKKYEETIAELNQNALSHEKSLQEYKDLVKSLTNEKQAQEENFIQVNDKYNQMQSSLLDEKKTVLEEMEDLKKKFKELSEKHNATVLEKIEIAERSLELETSLEGLRSERSKMDKSTESESSGDVWLLRQELVSALDQKVVLQAQLNTLEAAHAECEERISKMEANLTATFTDIIKKLNTELKQSREELPRAKSSFTVLKPEKLFAGANAFVNKTTAKFSTSTTTDIDCKQQSSSSNTTEVSEKVKLLTSEKAELRLELVQARHQNEELKSHLKEANESTAALRSRIAVLEVELRNAKSLESADDDGMESDEFVDSISINRRFNHLEKEKRKLNEMLNKKEALIKQLRTNNEGLMKTNSEFYQQISSLKQEKDSLSEKLIMEESCKTTLEELQKVLDDLEHDNNCLQKNMEEATKEKERMVKQLNSLRKESVGKVSLSLLTSETECLREQLKSKEEKLAALEKSKSGVNTTNLICPFCMETFSSANFEIARKHIRDHID